MRKWLAASLVVFVVVAGVASGFVFAQPQTAEPRVMSGSDIGFRVDRMSASGEAIGALVVRINGKWVETTSGPTVRRAK